MTAARKADGKWNKGVSGNPAGRPKKDREVRYYDILHTAVTFEDWKEIVAKAVADAKRGDAVARKWLADYLIGPPIQRQELTGAEGAALTIHIAREEREGD